MKNKKVIIIFTDDSKLESAQAIKDFFADGQDNLPIIIAEEEFQSITAKLIKERIFNEDGTAIRMYEKAKERLQSRKIDKLPPQDISYKSNVVQYRKAYNILVRYNPHLIVLSGGAVMREILSARNKVNPDIKVVMAITDYVLNKQLINKHIDKYFVDNMGIKTTLVNEGIPEYNIVLTDFPLTKDLDKPVIKDDIYQEYGFLSDKPTAVLAVPFRDNYMLKSAMDELVLWQTDYNVIVDCGKDREMLLYAREKGLKAINEGKDNNPLYDIADIIISRPTPMIIAKSFYKQKLFLCLEPRTEKEKRTVDFLQDAIIRVDATNTISVHLKSYLRDTERFNAIRENINTHNNMRPKGLLWQALELLL